MVARHVRDRAAQDVPGAEAGLAVNGRVEEATGIGIRNVHAGACLCYPSCYAYPKGHPDHLPVFLRVCHSGPAVVVEIFCTGKLQAAGDGLSLVLCGQLCFWVCLVS